MNVKEGDVVCVASLGTVKIDQIFPSGAVNVIDLEGRLWLVTKDLLETVEQGLFTFA